MGFGCWVLGAGCWLVLTSTQNPFIISSLSAVALQNLDYFVLAVLLGEGKRGSTVGVLRVHVGPVLDEELHGVGKARVGGGDERGEAFGRVRVHVGPVREERVERGDATVGGGEDDGRESRIVAHVHVRALRYQSVDYLVVSSARGGEQEGRAAAVAARAHVRAARYEHLHDGEVFLKLSFGGLSLPLSGEGYLLRGGLHQGRVVVLVARVHVSALRQKELHNVVLTLPAGPEQRRPAIVWARVHVSALRQQLVRDIGVAVRRGERERRASVPVTRGRVRASSEQRADDRELAVRGGEDESGATVRGLRVHVRAARYERLRGRGVARLGCDHERGHSVGATRVRVGPLRQKRLDGVGVLARGGVDERRAALVGFGVRVRARLQKVGGRRRVALVRGDEQSVVHAGARPSLYRGRLRLGLRDDPRLLRLDCELADAAGQVAVLRYGRDREGQTETRGERRRVERLKIQSAFVSHDLQRGRARVRAARRWSG